jgi:uncharacterized protein YoxC
MVKRTVKKVAVKKVALPMGTPAERTAILERMAKKVASERRVGDHWLKPNKGRLTLASLMVDVAALEKKTGEKFDALSDVCKKSFEHLQHQHELTTMRIDKLTVRVAGCEDANGDIHARLSTLEEAAKGANANVRALFDAVGNTNLRVLTLVEHDTQTAKRLTELEHETSDIGEYRGRVTDLELRASGKVLPAPAPAPKPTYVRLPTDAELDVWREAVQRDIKACATPEFLAFCGNMRNRCREHGITVDKFLASYMERVRAREPAPKPKVHCERWLNLYPTGKAWAYDTRELADRHALPDRIECRKIEWEA